MAQGTNIPSQGLQRLGTSQSLQGARSYGDIY